MATLTKYPYGYAVITTGFTNAMNAFDDVATTFATCSPAKGATVTTQFDSFTLTSIPAGSIINSVTVELNVKVSAVSASLTLNSQVYLDTLAVPNAFTKTSIPTSLTKYSYTATGITRDDLVNGTFKVRVGATRIGNTAFTVSLDYVRVVIDYSAPIQHLVDVSCPDGHGTCEPPLGQTYINEGAVQYISAYPRTGYLFDYMTINDVVYTTNGNSITIDKDYFIVLYFKIDPSIKGIPSTGGAITTPTNQYAIPYNTYFHDNRLEFIILASELLACGLSAGNITKIGFKVENLPGRSLQNFRIRLKNTTSTVLSVTGWEAGLTLCYEEALLSNMLFVDIGGFTEHQLDTPFHWDGVSNLIIDTSRDSSAYTIGGTMPLQATPDIRALGYNADSQLTWDYSSATPNTCNYILVTQIGLIPDAVTPTIPTISIVSHTRDIISQVSGVTTSTIVFTSDTDLLEWEARADGAGVGQGILVGSGGVVTANTETSFDVDYTELTNGDKDYKINIYGRNSEGWSIYE